MVLSHKHPTLTPAPLGSTDPLLATAQLYKTTKYRTPSGVLALRLRKQLLTTVQLSWRHLRTQIPTCATAKMEQPLNNIQLHDDWGVYVSEDDEDEVTELTEGVDGYIVRVGFPGPPCYPMSVGELIQGGGKPYRIEHKLGHGAFSTVWLAFEVDTGTSVALKIHRTLTTAGQIESRMHQHIQQLISDPGNSHWVTSISAFSLPGRFPHDSNWVIVQPVMGPNLHKYMSSWGTFSDSATRFRLAKDILIAVACFHAHNLIHRGT